MSSSFGKSREAFAPEAVNAPAAMSAPFRNVSRYQLIQPSTGRAWWLKNGVTKIGRSLDNDIVLTDASVSRKHAQIRIDGGTIVIMDCASANGTTVSGEKVVHGMLPTETYFKLGKVELVVRKSSIYENAAAHWSEGASWRDTWG